jgi:hypothetical protein
MMKDNKEPVHLCPICTCVEMVFIERVANRTEMRTRRFKCPVCEHVEMYVMSGPHDADRQFDRLEAAKIQKNLEYRKRKNLI